MKKYYVAALQEILAEHITGIQDYVEQVFTLFSDPFLQISSGVITGLDVSSGSATTISVATGSIYMDGVFGELESASGLTLSLPVSGTRSDLIVCYYQEVLDQHVDGFVLLNIDTGQETIQSNPSRRFGAVVIQQLTNTTYATRPVGKIPLNEMTVTSSGISTMSDVRIYARIRRLQADIKQKFYHVFYAGF